jgi:hypothetical protein
MELYSHIEILFSILLGFGICHLLWGMARIVQHPKQYRVYWVHHVWVLFWFLYRIDFWWWEFRLGQVTWTFPSYFFITVYTTLLYVMCTLLFPDDMSGYNGFEEYFYLRKSWIFGLMTLLFLFDIADTLLKGVTYFRAMGPLYYLHAFSLPILALVATRVNNRAFQAAFAVFALITEIAVIVTAQLTMA